MEVPTHAPNDDIEDIAARGRVLLGTHPELREGLTLTMRAADAGHAEAECLLAVYLAGGVGVPQSWSAALDHLRRAAEHGSAHAQRQLVLLAGKDGVDTSAPGAWRILRDSVDLAAWQRPPGRHVVCASPRIATLQGFAAPALCDWLAARGQGKLAPARLYDPSGSRVETGRSNSAYHIPIAESDLPIRLLQSRIAAATERLPADMETPAVLHYAPGQEFLPHVDFLNTKLPAYARQVAEAGQRVVTFLLYLNDDYDGGETEFPALDWRFKGRKGDALFFWNVEPDGTPDPRTAHAGLPTTRGEKWLLSQWIRARPPRAAAPAPMPLG